jgi:hypothetical protein
MKLKARNFSLFNITALCPTNKKKKVENNAHIYSLSHLYIHSLMCSFVVAAFELFSVGLLLAQ